MKFQPNKAAALNNLKKFLQEDLGKYDELRNYYYGQDQKNYVSFLSPYITHGILNEKKIITEVLKAGSFKKNEKYIQEILWRTYWKGWLELRPKVWEDFVITTMDLEKKYSDEKKYQEAIEGKTQIGCFNDWVFELKKNNYLHNHVRMWFASIWIFTLNLPWQLGASFFLKHLFDGDAASNTLGWRWVAGVQTKGKHYLAKSWNIEKFTKNKYSGVKLNETAKPIVEYNEYPVEQKKFNTIEINQNLSLLIFDNSLSFEISDFVDKKFNKIYLVKSNNESRRIGINEKVDRFKLNLIEDQFQILKSNNITTEIINIDELLLSKEKFYAFYPNVGENMDFIKIKNIRNINYLYREIDKYSWKFCNKGFFNFKKNIPDIIEKCFIR